MHKLVSSPREWWNCNVGSVISASYHDLLDKSRVASNTIMNLNFFMGQSSVTKAKRLVLNFVMTPLTTN